MNTGTCEPMKPMTVSDELIKLRTSINNVKGMAAEIEHYVCGNCEKIGADPTEINSLPAAINDLDKMVRDVDILLSHVIDALGFNNIPTDAAVRRTL